MDSRCSMNVFDFDKTIYYGNSTADFYFFLLLRHPLIAIYLPLQLYAAIRYYVFHRGTKTMCKEKFYMFFRRCDAQADLELFWKKHLQKLKPFYYSIRRSDDVIISASPEFLLKPLEELIGVHVIASQVSPKDGKALGENCYYEEKVRRFREQYPTETIYAFYSDSLSDEPMARLAQHAYLVDGDQIRDWDFDKHKKNIHI